MKKKKITLSLVLILMITSILVSCGQKTSRTMTIVGIQGQPEIMKKGSSDWSLLLEGMRVEPGDTLRTGDEEYIWAEIDDGSRFGLGKKTVATLTTLSKSYTDPVTLIDLSDGMVFVTVTKSLGKGSFEVKTLIITVGVVGSKMAVNYDSTKQTEEIACLEGTVTGKYGDDTASPQVDSGYILGLSVGTIESEFNSSIYQAHPADEVYNEFNYFDSRYRSSYSKTMDPLYTATSLTQTQLAIEKTRLASITPSPLPTLEPTQTLTPTITNTPGVLSRLRPTITVDPLLPLSAEEEANEGIHNYSFSAAYSGNCKGETSGRIEQLMVQFKGNQAILSDNNHQSIFSKVDENTYQGYTEFEVIFWTFTTDGFVMEQAGCVNYNYVRE